MSNTDVAKDAPKGERKERKGGKGGEKRGGRKGGEKGGDGAREGGGRGEGGKGGKGNRPRKPRAEIPTFEDPEAELAKVEAEGEPPRANRDSLDRKIAGIQNEIDASKRRTEAITRDLDAIKEKNEKLKSSGSGPLEKSREVLRELKKQIVGVIEERKSVSAQIDTIREKKKTMDEQIQKQKAAIGRFTSNEMIDEEIRRIEDHMAHNTMDLKQEKAYMLEIKELNKKRDEVKALEQMEGKRSSSGGKVLSLPELFEARKKVDEKLDVLRAQEKTAVEQMNAIREKTQDRSSSERFEKLLAERKEIRDKIGEKIAEIRVLRDEFQKVDDKWYEHDRLVKNIKWQIRQANLKKREEDQKKWEEEKKLRGEEWAKEQEYKKNFNEDGTPKEKFMDYDLAERIAICEQLITFLQKYVPSEGASTEVAKEAVKDARTVDTPDDVTAYKRDNVGSMDDSLGLNAFMVDEVVSKKSKKNKKKAKQIAEKNDEAVLVAQGETFALTLSLDMIQHFSSMNLAVPVDTSDAAASMGHLKDKKAYYEQKGAAGMTLKEVIKEEKEAKKPKKEPKEAKPKEGKKKDEAKEEAAPKEEAKKPGRDFGAEKLARKAAEMPEVDPDIDLAAMRAKAQAGNQMTEEEKKARGLLYDVSKASAVRDDSDEDDEGACDMGGDPFEGL